MPAAKKKVVNLCKDVPPGEVLTDLRKQRWVTGKPIGSGGFGFIYLAKRQKNEDTKATDDSPQVVKIEPHENGPLASEIVFYQRAAKEEKIEEWKKLKNLKNLSVPHFIASGLHQLDGKRYRFLIMPKYGSDLHKLWMQANKKFHRSTVVRVGIAMLHSLEYLHSNEYVHADIKGANILCGSTDPNQIYLVDYGLAYRYIVDGKHKSGKPDPRRAHNGTIEYTSTDAHAGSNASRRGDLEILAFVLIHWLAGSLPWDHVLEKPDKVSDLKNQFMADIKSSVKKLCPDELPDEIVTLFEYANQLKYEETPNYQYLFDIFNKTLKYLKVKPTSPLDWTSAAPVTTTKSNQIRPLASKTNDDDVAVSNKKKKTTTTKKSKIATKKQQKDEEKVAKNLKKEEKIPVMKNSRKRPTVKKMSTAAAQFSDSDDVSDDDVILPAVKRNRADVIKQTDVFPMTSDTDEFQTPPPSVTSSKRARRPINRYSMAPLHTESILTKDDKLTGRKFGKHPEFLREKRKNVPKSDAVTQTTPGLKKNKRSSK